MPPVITTAPPPLVTVTKVHDTVILQCAAQGSPVPTLEWRKDGVVISTNITLETADEARGKLIIPKFGPSDQGVYTLKTTTTELPKLQPPQVKMTYE